jgi:hypothetical protein
VPEFQGERARVLTDLGLLRDSPAELDDAYQVFHRLVRDNPNVTRFRAGAARNKAARGTLLLARGVGPADFDEGRRLLFAAREEQRSLIDADPENFDYRFDLRQTETALIGSAPQGP